MFRYAFFYILFETKTLNLNFQLQLFPIIFSSEFHWKSNMVLFYYLLKLHRTKRIVTTDLTTNNKFSSFIGNLKICPSFQMTCNDIMMSVIACYEE